MEPQVQARRIAALARISWDDKELPQIVEQFQRILAYVSRIAEVDVEGVEPFISAAEGEPWREDEPRTALTREDALANAPQQSDGFFHVPRIA